VKRQRLARTDEARIHLRDRPGDDSDRAVLDASLKFRRGLGTKSSCKVKKILSEDQELLLENSIVCIAGFVGNANGIKRNTSEGTVACSFLP
jgi:hypothetical protein